MDTYDLSNTGKLSLTRIGVTGLTPLQDDFVRAYVGDKMFLIHKKTGELFDGHKVGVNRDEYELVKSEHPSLTDIVSTAEIGKLYPLSLIFCVAMIYI